MPLRYAATALLFLGLIGFPGCTSSLEKEEAAVYAAYVDARFTTVADSTEHLKRHIICGHTAGLEMLRSWPKVIGDLSIAPTQETIDDFVARNEGRHAINERIGFGLPHTLIPDGSIDRLFERSPADGWVEFNRRYPKNHGILWLSRVGFNSHRNEALLYVGNQWTDAAGEGFLVLLKKRDGIWKEVTRSPSWVS